jgi:hypothetical protein
MISYTRRINASRSEGHSMAWTNRSTACSIKVIGLNNEIGRCSNRLGRVSFAVVIVAYHSCVSVSVQYPLDVYPLSAKLYMTLRLCVIVAISMTATKREREAWTDAYSIPTNTLDTSRDCFNTLAQPSFRTPTPLVILRQAWTSP